MTGPWGARVTTQVLPALAPVWWGDADRRVMKANKGQKAKRNFVLRIPNTAEGELFYNLFRKYLNTDSYGIDRKASGKRANGQFNTTMDNADSVRLYLQAKPSKGLRQVDRQGVQI